MVLVRIFDDDSYDGGASGGPRHGGMSGGPRDGRNAPDESGGAPVDVVQLPDCVGKTPAGAELAALLEDVPVEQVSGFDTVEYMKAAHRLATHYQGVFLKALLETGIRLPSPDDQVVRAETPGEFACEEARAALVWSRSRAEGTLGRAYQLFGQSPAVGSALVDAAIDEPRANAFINWTNGLSDDHTSRIVDELLPAAPMVTVGELIDRIKKLAIALDPEWAERRYRESLNERRVELRQTQFGTADLAGRELPVDRAKAGADRIHALATSCKNAGDSRRIDLIRADLYLGMLDGLFQHMTDEQVVEHVLAHPVTDDVAGRQDEDGGENADGTPGSNEPDDGGGRGPGDSPAGPARGGGQGPGDGGQGPGGRPAGPAGTSAGPAGGGTPARPASSGGHTPNEPTGGSAGGSDDENPAHLPAGSAWNVHELRAELTTLLGMDEHPAELPGVGYIPASVAREHAAFMASGEWRFVICTEEGVPICSGVTSRRPTTAGQGRDAKRGGILEIQIDSNTLADLLARTGQGEHAAWAPVIHDIDGRYRRGILDNAPAGEGQPDGAVAANARRRRARAGLRRWIEVRDRYCLHPACRMPASQTDQDHRIDYATGGPTVEQNLDSECRHDHRLQQDGGWQVHRLEGSDPLTGAIVWTSPLGHQYESRPPPVMTRYPQPGNHYPGHDTMPEWFTSLMEQVKARHASADHAGSDNAETEDDLRRPAKPTPEVPPF